MPEKKKNVTVRLPVEIWKSISKKCLDEDTDLQKVGAMLYERWLKEPPTKKPKQPQ
jgi:hypothetical protein